MGNTTSTSYARSGLSNSTTYYWKIVAKNTCGNSTSGPVWSFTTGSANNSLLLGSPLNGTVFNSCSLINTHQPYFGWSVFDIFTKYSILFSTSLTDFTNHGALVATGNARGPNSSWTPSKFAWTKIVTSSYNNGNIRDIYWKVIGTKPDRTTVESEVRSFRIGDSQAVTIISPADGATLSITTPPTFNFNSNCNVKFRLEFSPQPDNFNIPNKIKGYTYQVKDPITESIVNWTLASYYWTGVVKLVGYGIADYGVFRIRAWDGMNRETVSETRSFAPR